jgi:hypothetical protein
LSSASAQWCVASAALRVLSVGRTWTVQMWKLDDEDRPVCRLAPSVVPIVSLGDAKHFWPVAKKAARKRPLRGDAAVVGPVGFVLAIEDLAGDFGGDEAAVDDEDEDPLDGVPPDLEALLARAMLDEMGGDDADDAPDGGIDPDEAVRLPRVRADNSMLVPGGRITFYVNKGDFEAVCTPHGRADGTRCVVTRTNSAYASRSSHVGPPIGGRPLGLLIAWLARGCDCERCPDRASHRTTISAIEASFDERYSARLSATHLLGFNFLVSCERQDWHDDELPFEPSRVAA